MNEAEQEAYEERAAILEFSGGMPRAEAEVAARAEVEQDIFRSMVRHLIRLAKSGKREEVVRWLDAANIKGGRDSAERKRYVDALNEQIKLGNAGAIGEWKESK